MGAGRLGLCAGRRFGAEPCCRCARGPLCGQDDQDHRALHRRGSSDIIARAISTPLAEALKATVVDNKVGANGNIGADFGAKAASNGLTLLMCDARALAISPSLYTQLPFDPSKNLHPVAMLRSATPGSCWGWRSPAWRATTPTGTA